MITENVILKNREILDNIDVFMKKLDKKLIHKN